MPDHGSRTLGKHRACEEEAQGSRASLAVAVSLREWHRGRALKPDERKRLLSQEARCEDSRQEPLGGRGGEEAEVRPPLGDSPAGEQVRAAEPAGGCWPQSGWDGLEARSKELALGAEGREWVLSTPPSRRMDQFFKNGDRPSASIMFSSWSLHVALSAAPE